MSPLLIDDENAPTDDIKGCIIKMKSDLQRYEAVYIKRKENEINQVFNEKYEELKAKQNNYQAEIVIIKESLEMLQKTLSESENSLNCTRKLDL